MVQRKPRRPHFRNIVSLSLVALLVSLSLAACSSPGDEIATAIPTDVPTQTPTLSPTSVSETATSPPVVEPTATTTFVQQETSAEIDPQALATAIADLVSDTDGLVEVVVSLPDGTIMSEINSYEPIEAASLYKLDVMVELFAQREMGELSFDEELVLDPAYFLEEDSVFGEADIGSALSIETLLQAMITLSSNVAATALLARVGNENVNLTMASLGLTNTEIRWSPDNAPDGPVFDEEEPVIEEPEQPVDEEPVEEPTEEAAPTVEEEPTEEEGRSTGRSLLRGTGHLPLLDPRADAALNVTNAADMAALYLMLINGQIISDAASQEMLVLLEDQQINDRLPAYLPADTVVAHKTGNLDGLIHDAGIIFAPAGPIIVVVLTEDVDELQAIDLIATVARLAYDAGS